MSETRSLCSRVLAYASGYHPDGIEALAAGDALTFDTKGGFRAISSGSRVNNETDASTTAVTIFHPCDQ